MKGLRQDAKPLSDLFPIRAGILPVLPAVAAQPDAKITQRPDNALARSMARGRDRLHIGYAKAGHHEEHLGDLGVRLRGFEANPARECA